MKKKIRAAIIISVAILAILTFVSRSVYNRNLLQVSAITVERGFVTTVWETTGTLHFPNAVNVSAGGTWRVSDVLVQEGDIVYEGELLVSFDKRLIDIEQQAIELEILRLNNSLAALEDLRSPQTAEERRARERQRVEIESSLALTEARLDYLLFQAPPSDGLLSPISGMVHRLNIGPGSVMREGDVILILLPDETPEILFSLPDRQQMPVLFPPVTASGSIIRPTVQAFKEVTSQVRGMVLHEHLTVNGHVVHGSLRSGRWECRALLTSFDDAWPILDQDVRLTVSLRSEMQDLIVPLSSIEMRPFDMAVVYIISSRQGLFGLEDYLVETEVQILFDNGRIASIADTSGRIRSGTVIASNPSGEMRSGETVWVRERR